MTEEVKEYEMTELGNAEFFKDLTQGNIIYEIEEKDKWLVWDGIGWADAQPEHLMRYYKLIVQHYAGLATEALAAVFKAKENADWEVARTQAKRDFEAADAAHKAINGWYKKCQTNSVFTNTIKLFKTLDGCAVSIKDMDSDPMLLGVKNGVVDLNTGELLSEKDARDAYVMQKCDVDYDINDIDSYNYWNKLVLKIVGGNEQELRYLQVLFGSAIVGKNSSHFAFIHGEGNNGKSTILEGINAVLGSYGVSGKPEIFGRNSNGNTKEYHYATWKGKRLLAFNETDKKDLRMSESLIKQTTDSPTISARHPAGRPFDYAPQFTPIFSVNHLPEIGTDQAVWRRVGIIEFNYKIPEKDKRPMFMEELHEQYGSGILNWLLVGAADYIQNGQYVPDCVKVQTAKIREDNNEVLQFLITLSGKGMFNGVKNWKDDSIQHVLNDKILLTDLLDGYEQYRKVEKIPNCPKARTFAGELRQIGIEVKKSTGNKSFVFGLKSYLKEIYPSDKGEEWEELHANVLNLGKFKNEL